MKGLLKGCRTIALGLAAVLCAGVPARAQMPGASQGGVNAAMLKLFGNATAFSAKAQVRMLDGAKKEILSTTMDFAVLDRKVRAELDMTQVRSAEMSAEDLANYKKMGMARVITIARPDRRSSLVLYPELQSYVETPMTASELAEFNVQYQVEKTRLGKETIDGHACEKNRVVLKGGKGEKHEAVVWNAADLNGFPLMMQLNQQEATVVFHYSEVKLARPETNLFDPPARYVRHESIEKMVRDRLPAGKK